LYTSIVFESLHSQLEILKKIAFGTEGSCCPYREGDSPRLLPRPLLEKHYSAANKTDPSATRHP